MRHLHKALSDRLVSQEYMRSTGRRIIELYAKKRKDCENNGCWKKQSKTRFAVRDNVLAYSNKWCHINAESPCPLERDNKKPIFHISPSNNLKHTSSAALHSTRPLVSAASASTLDTPKQTPQCSQAPPQALLGKPDTSTDLRQSL